MKKNPLDSLELLFKKVILPTIRNRNIDVEVLDCRRGDNWIKAEFYDNKTYNHFIFLASFDERSKRPFFGHVTINGIAWTFEGGNEWTTDYILYGNLIQNLILSFLISVDLG